MPGFTSTAPVAVENTNSGGTVEPTASEIVEFPDVATTPFMVSLV